MLRPYMVVLGLAVVMGLGGCVPADAAELGARAEGLRAQAAAAEAQAQAVRMRTQEARDAAQVRLMEQERAGQLTAEAVAVAAQMGTATAWAELSSLEAQRQAVLIANQQEMLQATMASNRATQEYTSLQATQEWRVAGIDADLRRTQAVQAVLATEAAIADGRSARRSVLNLALTLTIVIVMALLGVTVTAAWRWAETRRRALEALIPKLTLFNGMGLTWDGSAWRVLPSLPSAEIRSVAQIGTDSRPVGEMEAFVLRAIDVAGEQAALVPRWDKMAVSASTWHRLTSDLERRGRVRKERTGTRLTWGDLQALLADVQEEAPCPSGDAARGAL